MANVADVVVLIGGIRAEYVARGLRDEEFCGEIYRYDTLEEAKNDFSVLLRPRDNLLLLNDLPDVYDE